MLKVLSDRAIADFNRLSDSIVGSNITGRNGKTAFGALDFWSDRINELAEKTDNGQVLPLILYAGAKAAEGSQLQAAAITCLRHLDFFIRLTPKRESGPCAC